MVPTAEDMVTFYNCKFLILVYDDDRQSWETVKIITAPTYNDSRTKIALWNDPQIIIAPTYDDSRAKIVLWNDPLKENC